MNLKPLSDDLVSLDGPKLFFFFPSELTKIKIFLHKYSKKCHSRMAPELLLFRPQNSGTNYLSTSVLVTIYIFLNVTLRLIFFRIILNRYDFLKL